MDFQRSEMIRILMFINDLIQAKYYEVPHKVQSILNSARFCYPFYDPEQDDTFVPPRIIRYGHPEYFVNGLKREVGPTNRAVIPTFLVD